MRDWKSLMAEACTDVADLQEHLRVGDADLASMLRTQETYPMLVNPYYLSLIDADMSDDPIRMLGVPGAEELLSGGQADTSNERGNTVIPGVQHKYAQTALVLTTSACAMYCRHCFRRRFVGVSAEETVRDIEQVAAYIREHEEITNVLLSGGDAFMNSNETLHAYLEALCDIDHVRFIRFGTRMPVVLPQRITTDPELVALLEEFSQRKQLYVVTHFDHVREVTPDAHAAARTLLHAGVPVRNQTVLLRGVNDSASSLAELLDAITSIGVQPYYVFQCRPATGVKNRFQVPLREGLAIVEAARARLNGPAKGFRYVLSHPRGKIEVVGELETGVVLFKMHQAKDPAELGKVFAADLADDECWLP